MNVKKNRSVDFAIKTLTPEERRKVLAWLDHLANWENDRHTREGAKSTADPNVLALTTSDDFRIFFSLDDARKEMTVLDIARPSRYGAAGHASE